jgi:N12 class adenine-specific DNA methylase
MRYQWPISNINLEKISEKIAEFFKNKNFSTKIVMHENEAIISATPNINTEIQEKIAVKLERKEKRLTINFSSAEEKEKRIKIGMLLTFLLGGTLLLKELKEKEKIDALQEEFWAHVQKLLADYNVM